MNAKELIKKTIFLFHGQDSFSSQKKLNFWKSEFLKKHGESNFETIDAKAIDPNNFTTNLEALPFLADKRMIIIKNLFSTEKSEKLNTTREKIAKALEKVPDFLILIFYEEKDADKRLSLYKKIDQYGQVDYFPILSPNATTKWILEKAKERNINIDFATATYLSNYLGFNLWSISNELDKLDIFANGAKITNNMIDDLITPSLSASIFKLTDAIAEKNIKTSLKTFKILSEIEEEISRIFFMIVRHFRLLICVHDLLAKKERQVEIIKRLNIHPFVLTNMSRQSKNFTQESLTKIYNDLLKIDVGVKTGTIKFSEANKTPFLLEIEKFIINCCTNS